jgi:hypothetical protein
MATQHFTQKTQLMDDLVVFLLYHTKKEITEMFLFHVGKYCSTIKAPNKRIFLFYMKE